MPDTLSNIKNNLPLISLVFFAGVFYNVQNSHSLRMDDIEDRLDKKVKIQNELGDRIDDVEGYIDWEKGYREGKNE